MDFRSGGGGMAAQKPSVFCRLCSGLAAKAIPNEPGSAKPHSPPGSKQTQTVKGFTYFFFYYFQKFLSQTQAPEAEKVPT